MFRNRRLFIAVGVVTAASCLAWQPLCASPRHLLVRPAHLAIISLDLSRWDKDSDRMAVFQYAAQHGDRSHVAQMIGLLKSPQKQDYTLTLAYSLSVLGADDALPVIDKVIARVQAPGYHTYYLDRLPIIRARLVAEIAAKKMSTPAQRAQVKVQTFLKQVGLSTAGINAMIDDYNAKLKIDNPDADVPGPLKPSGVLACEELADIVYQSGDYASYASIPEIKQIHFASFPSAAIKMRLAPLDRAQRIKTMVEQGGKSGPEIIYEDYEQQLLIDEGKAARDAIIAAHAADRAMLFSYVLDDTGGLEIDPPAEKRIKSDDNAPISSYRMYRVIAY